MEDNEVIDLEERRKSLLEKKIKERSPTGKNKNTNNEKAKVYEKAGIKRS